MNLRYIALDCEYNYPSDSFYQRFRANTNFIQDYLSKEIRKQKLPIFDDYNMICVKLSSTPSSIRLLPSLKVLEVNLLVEKSELEFYEQMRTLEERCEFCLSLLERGYRLASLSCHLPLEQLLDLHERFKQIGYLDEWLIKRLTLRPQGVKISLIGCFTALDFHVTLKAVNNKTATVITEQVIIRTDPYWVCFEKDIKNIHIENNDIIIEDSFGNINVMISLSELIAGKVVATYSSAFSDRMKKYEKSIQRLTW